MCYKSVRDIVTSLSLSLQAIAAIKIIIKKSIA